MSIVATVKESKDLSTLTLVELMSSLKAHENKQICRNKVEQVLQSNLYISRNRENKGVIQASKTKERDTKPLLSERKLKKISTTNGTNPIMSTLAQFVLFATNLVMDQKAVVINAPNKPLSKRLLVSIKT